MTLLDTLLPRFDFREQHETTVRAPAPVILDAILNHRTDDDPLFRLAFAIRNLPARVLGTKPHPPMGVDDFTRLGRDGDRALAMGLVGAFWKSDLGLLDIADVAAFQAARGWPGVCRLAIGFEVESLGDGVHRLRTETRVECPSAAERRKFAPYWCLIRPVSGLIRRRLLADVRRTAEGAAVAG